MGVRASTNIFLRSKKYPFLGMCSISQFYFILRCDMTSHCKKEIETILNSNNHYEILGVKSNASKQEIKQAYRNNALKYHPDKNNLPQAKQLFHKVTNAYEHLTDHNKKANFDRNCQNMKKQNGNGRNERKERPTGPPQKEFRREDKPKPPPQATWQRANKPDYSKYFNPPKNPYNPKRPDPAPQPQPEQRSNSPFDEAERKRQSYKLKTQKTSWVGVFFTFFMFFVFWTLVPDFTSRRRQKKGPSFLLNKNEEYTLKVKTSRYKFPYYIRPQHLNETLTMDSRVQELTLRKLQSDCQQSLSLKQKYDTLMVEDKVNIVFWQSQRSDINFKPCRKILKLIKKYPEIKLGRFKHLNK